MRPTGYGDLKVFSGSAHPQLAKEICEFLGVSLGQARLRRFPDTEVSFQIDENDWLGRKDSNLRIRVPKTRALPLGHAPSRPRSRTVEGPGRRPGTFPGTPTAARQRTVRKTESLS